MPALDFATISQWALPLILIVVMLVAMIVPQKRQEKKIKEMLDNVKVGDYIRTIGGIYGTISEIKGSLITIESGPDKTKIVFSKSAISTVEHADVEAEM
ncbi:MAG: preprotein translocase subunit YajC [Clostridia bacterium]|nr:preprotein translocase subunit YajC [Clostridia bacterium]